MERYVYFRAMGSELRWVTLVYALLAVSYLAIHLNGAAGTLTVALHKASPVLLLMLWAVTRNSAHNSRFLAVALGFSALGDILLALPLNHGFTLGLSAFLLGHLAYIGCFVRAGQGKQGFAGHSVSRWRKAVLLLLILYLVSMLVMLLPASGELAVAVGAYVLVIGAMAAVALRRGNPLSVFGAFVFVFSDSLIAINKFLVPLPMASLAIMTSYYLAQWCLCNGILAQPLKISATSARSLPH